MKQLLNETILIAAAALLALLFWLGGGYFDAVANTTFFVPNNANERESYDISKFPTDWDRLHQIELEIEPEFIRAMNSAIPIDVNCLKIRYKKVPVASVKVDGEVINDKFFARYRGFCHEHWAWKAKSLKLQASEKEPFWGYQEINLNAFNTDPFLYEYWSSRLLEETGGLAVRMGFVKLFINGEYFGVRQLSENLDSDFLRVRKRKMGPIYREVTHADPGRVDRESLQILWQKNTQKNKTWDDLYNFHENIISAVRHEDAMDQFFSGLNLKDYINYYAVIAIVGTNHLNNHNIPIYRPKNDKRFSPIGYDFGSPWASSFHKANLDLPMLHISLLSMNWIHQLFLTTPNMRLKIEGRIAEILQQTDLAQIYNNLLSQTVSFVTHDLKLGFILDHFKDFDGTYSQYTNKNLFRNAIENRLNHLKKMYLDPVVILPPDWRKKDDFQFIIDGLGSYDLEFTFDSTNCTNEMLAIKVHTDDYRKVVECNRNRLSANRTTVARFDIMSPSVERKPDIERNSIGPLLVAVKQVGRVSGLQIIVTSKQTGNVLQRVEEWPFYFKRRSKLSFGINSNVKWVDRTALTQQIGFTWVDVNEGSSAFTETSDRSEINLTGAFQQENSYDLNKWGPILCWHLKSSSNCFEFSKEFVLSAKLIDRSSLEREVKKFRLAHAQKVQNSDSKFYLTQERINDCKSFTFSKNNWLIKESLVFPKECEVNFLSGATIVAENSDVYVVINGQASFQNGNLPIKFTSNSEYWGGVVLLNNPQQEILVQNTIFTKSNEFSFNGTRYTGALNVIGANNYLIRDNQFFDNLGDDGLNVKGGEGRISSNYFFNNRDGLDIDVTKAIVEYNFFGKSLDDSIDCGTATAEVSHNYIQKSGDKGVSVGEASAVILNNNIIKAGNTGVGVKDSSTLTMVDNLFYENEIALNIYAKNEVKSAVANIRVSGASQFRNNEINYKFGGAVITEIEKVVAREGIDETKLLKKIDENCKACMIKGKEKSKVGSRNGVI